MASAVKRLSQRLSQSITGKQQEECNRIYVLPEDSINNVLQIQELKAGTTFEDGQGKKANKELDNILETTCEDIYKSSVYKLLTAYKLQPYIQYLKERKSLQYEIQLLALQKLNGENINFKNKEQSASLQQFSENFLKNIKKDDIIKAIVSTQNNIKRLDYLIFLLSNVYDQLYKSSYINNKGVKQENARCEENKNIVSNIRTEGLLSVSALQSVLKLAPKSVDIKADDEPKYYPFSIDLSVMAHKNKRKAWVEFNNQLNKWLESDEFGQQNAYDGNTIAENFERLKTTLAPKVKGETLVTDKPLYYLVFKINQMWDSMDNQSKEDFKNNIIEQIRKDANKQFENPEPIEIENACTLKPYLQVIKSYISNKLSDENIDENLGKEYKKIKNLLMFIANNLKQNNETPINEIKEHLFGTLELSPMRGKPKEGLVPLYKLLNSIKEKDSDDVIKTAFEIKETDEKFKEYKDEFDKELEGFKGQFNTFTDIVNCNQGSVSREEQPTEGVQTTKKKSNRNKENQLKPDVINEMIIKLKKIEEKKEKDILEKIENLIKSGSPVPVSTNTDSRLPPELIEKLKKDVQEREKEDVQKNKESTGISYLNTGYTEDMFFKTKKSKYGRLLRRRSHVIKKQKHSSSKTSRHRRNRRSNKK